MGRGRVAVVGLLALGACSREHPAITAYPAGDLARRQGIEGYQILKDRPTELDLNLSGRPAAKLAVRILGGVTTQSIEREGGRFGLRTSFDRVEVEENGRYRVAAERMVGGWKVHEGLGRVSTDWLAFLLAIDVDLAVQGTSMVFQGRRYAWCTLECERAAGCARQGTPLNCLEQLVTCGACLEQEP
jgi:hypothetical protein